VRVVLVRNDPLISAGRAGETTLHDVWEVVGLFSGSDVTGALAMLKIAFVCHRSSTGECGATLCGSIKLFKVKNNVDKTRKNMGTSADIVEQKWTTTGSGLICGAPISGACNILKGALWITPKQAEKRGLDRFLSMVYTNSPLVIALTLHTRIAREGASATV